ncbi:alpha/beta fold hydrolase [Sessilibacter corallicola]|uniref:alpha/beta fold hydrolase n=1 Tax=Sessilibacter corallicola TaxID=2904075 RepID=UPI001E2AE783|nr:alpha/beta hydrolase [Sessilibacter corallicola]MCE2028527.1 alpha/beta hydrolase [Sessilibacter corallicola]
MSKCTTPLRFLLTVLIFVSAASAQALSGDVRYGTEKVDGQEIFFREAGDPSNPAIVLLHGFPSSSHMYRELLASLSDDYYLIAPDYPGFGNSSFPSKEEFTYTFDNLAKVVNTFLEKKGVKKYSIMMQDYGAPIGFRIAAANPERVQSIITQNGNAYEVGINKDSWAPIIQYWSTPTKELGAIIEKNVYSADAMKWQYTHGTRNPESILPDNWILDYANISRPGQTEIQLALFYDYQNNVKLYPQWQAYLRKEQPPVLVVWGKNDAFFPESGAEAFKKDVKDIDYNILNTGHFALEEDHAIISEKIRHFLAKRKIK